MFRYSPAGLMIVAFLPGGIDNATAQYLLNYILERLKGIFQGVVLCLCYVSVMSLLCLCYVSVMSLLCLCYVSFMSLLCLFYVSFMSLLCLFYVSCMSVRVCVYSSPCIYIEDY